MGDIRNYVTVYLFATIRGVRFVNLMMCWNIVVFIGLTIDDKSGLF